MGRIRNKVVVKQVSRNIKQIRQEKGITQEDFLFDLGIHIGRIEMGNNDISCSTLMAICDKLSISPVEFFQRMENDTQNGYSTNLRLTGT